MNKLTSKYLIVLGVLTLVILGSQILMQDTIKQSKSDSRIINISGRQRMLSQKIAKVSLKIKEATNRQAYEEAQKELRDASALWAKSHDDLRFGDSQMDMDEMNSTQAVKDLFEKIEPFFLAIKKASDQLLATTYDKLSDEYAHARINKAVNQITSNEADFLELMNRITFQYDRQASSKIEKLSDTEYYLLGFTFVLILMEIFFIFRPLFMESKKKETLISELSTTITDTQIFSSSQIKLANQKIKQLQKLALSMKEDLLQKEKEYTYKITDRMTKNLELSSTVDMQAREIQKLKNQLQGVSLNLPNRDPLYMKKLN